MSRAEYRFKATFGIVKTNGKYQDDVTAYIYAETKEAAQAMAEELARKNRQHLNKVEWS